MSLYPAHREAAISVVDFNIICEEIGNIDNKIVYSL